MHLVAFFETAQNTDRVLHRGWFHQHRGEAPFERWVLFDVLAEFVEGRGSDHPEFATSQHGFQHVRGVHGSLGGAGAHDGVHFVDERDDLAFRGFDLVENGLQALLELAPVLGARHHRRQIQGDDPLVLEALGHVAVGDAAGQALDDGCLADPGFADEDGVVLRAPGEHLDDPADLVIATDHRVELLLPGGFGEVAAVLLERIEGGLGVLARDSLAAPQIGERSQDGIASDAQFAEGRPGVGAAVGKGKDQMLHRQVVVLELGSDAVSRFQQLDGLAGERRFLPAVHLRHAVQHGVDLTLGHWWLYTNRVEQRVGDAVGHAQQRHRNVGRLNLGVVSSRSDVAGGGECLLGLVRQLVEVECHGSLPSGAYRCDVAAFVTTGIDASVFQEI